MVIDFYLDFISPFAYLARGRLLEIATRCGAEVVYRPVDIFELRRNAGSTGPSNSQIPAKLAYFTRDRERWAEHYGLPIAPALSGYQTQQINCGLYLALERGQQDRYAELAAASVWRDARDPAAPETFGQIEEQLGWRSGALAAFTSSPEAVARYAAETAAASERGVFGVPTFMVGAEMWWGNDRLAFLDRYLQGG